jgi:hypothetical protein
MVALKDQVKSAVTTFSKFALLRKHVSFFRDWHDGYVLGDPSKKAVAVSRAVGLYRGVFFWRFAPRKYVGGAVLNLLGLQIFRYGFYNIRYLLRSGHGLYASEIRTVGMLIKRGFLSHEGVQQVLHFYEKNKIDCANHFRDFSELVISNSKGVSKDRDDYRHIADYLLKNCGISQIGVDLTGISPRISPFISILHYKSYIDQKDQSDGQDTPHADVFYPSFKLFIYLNDVDESNGAFRYLLTSNRFSFKAAINAYKDSLKYYFGGGKRQLYPTDASVGMTGEGLKWESASGKPGDCIAFNVQGVHRRGDFKKDTYRERLVLLVDFRQMEVPVQQFAANV